jgi:hypothetical protein
MDYFNIQPITISLSPFETAEVNAIRWSITHLDRGATEALINCALFDDQGLPGSYTWVIPVPKSILDQWLDDVVIDNYICSTDTRFIKV